MWSGHSCPLPLTFFDIPTNQACPTFRGFRKVGTTDLDYMGQPSLLEGGQSPREEHDFSRAVKP